MVRCRIGHSGRADLVTLVGLRQNPAPLLPDLRCRQITGVTMGKMPAVESVSWQPLRFSPDKSVARRLPWANVCAWRCAPVWCCALTCVLWIACGERSWGQTASPPFAAGSPVPAIRTTGDQPASNLVPPSGFVQGLPSVPHQGPSNSDIDERVLIQRLEPVTEVVPPLGAASFGQPPVIPSPSVEPPGLQRLPPLNSDRVFDEPPVLGESVRFPRLRFLGRQVVDDHLNYYSWRTARIYALSFGVGAVCANTALDQHFQTWYQDNIDSGFIHSFKYFGEGVIVLPTYFAAAAVGYWFEDRPAGSWLEEWGLRSLRTFVVGAPPMLLMQGVTGGSRPGEQPYNSAWRPFQDNNGVSGHAFMGAIPFLTAAEMTDRPALKFSLYALSTLTGWSRVNDNAHYFSQAFLGWWMAYAAVVAVDETQRSLTFQVVPMVASPGTQGLVFEWRR